MTDETGTASHSDTADRERQRREAALDETIAQSFPASDPPSTDPNPDSHASIGIYILAHPVAGLASLTLAVATYLFVEGMLEFTVWFQLRGTPGNVWLLLDGIVTLILAAMIGSTWPSSAAWVVGTLVGISMFFSGISRLVVSLAVHRLTA